MTKQPGTRRVERIAVSGPDLETIVHDFRNLLQCAGSAMRLAAARLWAAEDEPPFELLQEATAALTRADRLAHDIVAGHSSPARTSRVQVPGLLRDIAGILRHAAGASNRFDMLVCDRVPSLRCDARRLENVLVNLALNACEATQGGGAVLLEARECRLHHPWSSAQPCLLLSVSDNGRGMTDEVARRVAAGRFTTKAGGEGGRGLAEARRFAAEAGGLMLVRSRSGAGTQIALHLPAEPVLSK